MTPTPTYPLGRVWPAACPGVEMCPEERALRLQAAEISLEIHRLRERERQLSTDRDALLSAADRLAGRH